LFWFRIFIIIDFNSATSFLDSAFHHIPAFVNEVLPRLNEALRDGGYFVSFEATHNNFIFQKMRERIYTKNSVFENETEEAFEYNKLHRMFRKNNFILVDELHAGLLSYILYYNPEAFPWLNIGGATLVKLLFRLDGLFMRNLIGRKLSFATMSLWKKNA